MAGETVLITGLGVASPLGCSIASYWSALLRPGGFYPVNHPKLDARHVRNRLMYGTHLDGDPDGDGLSEDPAVGRASRFALAAARQSLRDAGLTRDAWHDIGVAIGTAMGNADLAEDTRAGQRPPGADPSCAYHVAATLAENLRLSGPNLSVSTACSASLYSISLGVEAIRAGDAEAMLVGGAEAFSRVALGCFNRLGALDDHCCRPFDRRRGGTVFGEGAAMLLLESRPAALRRGVTRAYATIDGFGWSCDGYHPTSPNPDGRQVEVAIRRALTDAGLDPVGVGCIIPHGTGTELNDLVESEVLGRIFGERIAEIPVCAIKSKVGHGGGAAGAFACLTGALIIDQGRVPPTANVTDPDPRCRVRLLTEAALAADVRYVLANAYAFGGNNISVVLGKSS